jgi:hypothetical protein
MTQAETPLRRLARRHAEGELPDAEYRRQRRSFLEALESGATRPPFSDWQGPPAQTQDWGEATLRLDLTEPDPAPERRPRRAGLLLALVALALALTAALLVGADAGPGASSLAP